MRHLHFPSHLILAIFGFLCYAVWYAGVPAFAVTDSKPNVIIILVDDMGWADLSCFGNQAIQTPNIDRLAAEGTAFTLSGQGRDMELFVSAFGSHMIRAALSSRRARGIRPSGS